MAQPLEFTYRALDSAKLGFKAGQRGSTGYFMQGTRRLSSEAQGRLLVFDRFELPRGYVRI